MKQRGVLLALLMIATLISGCSIYGAGSSDQATLEQLHEAGSDLSKLHLFDFYLYHPDQDGAGQLCAALSAEGFEVSVAKSAGGDDWLCLASLTMLPTIENLMELDARFNRLTDRYGGEYDGWETMVTP